MMTAEQLKESILQLAMQGKLVEQRPEEGTGEELYKEIIKGRERLVKEGKIKKDKEPVERIEEPPFDIPESWKWAKLNDIVAKTIKRGKSPKYTQYSNTLVFAQKCNTKAGSIDLSLCLYLDENQLIKYPKDEFMINEDIVINSTGNGTLGRVGVYRDSDNPNKLSLVPDSHVTVIRCSSLVNVGYVFYCLKYYQPYMEKLGSGSTNQTELRAGVLKVLSFPLPPLAEQKRIVAKIEELMPFVKQYAAASTKLNTLNITFLEMMKKSILQEAVQGKLVPQNPNDEPASVLLKKTEEEKKRLIKEGKIKKQKALPEIMEDEIPFDIPESWEWARLDDLVSFENGDRGKNYPNKAEYVHKGIAWINTGHIKTNGYLTKAKMNYITREKYNSLHSGKIEKCDLVFCLRGATFGKVARVEPFDEGAVASSLMIIRPIMSDLREYIFLYLKTPLAFSELRKYANGSAQPNLGAKDVRKYL